MYIEAIHDIQGNIALCYCGNFYPEDQSKPLVTREGGLPEGQEQSRIIIDTFLAMEISAGSGQKAVMDPATGQPKIVDLTTGDYVVDNFRVDMSAELAPPVGSMKVRGLVRK